MFPKWYKPPRRKVSGTVIERVAQLYKITPSDIRGHQRNRHFVEARWVCAEVLRSQNGLSYPAIGRLLNRDHTTIMHACQSVQHLRKYRPSIQDALDRLMA